MFIAIVDFTVAPADRPEALAAILAETSAVGAMTGNIAFLPYLHPVDPGALRIFHEWETAADFEAYAASSAFKALSQILRPLMTAAPVSRRLTADLLETVR
jgi:quinol monooxygenase YgiN